MVNAAAQLERAAWLGRRSAWRTRSVLRPAVMGAVPRLTHLIPRAWYARARAAHDRRLRGPIAAGLPAPRPKGLLRLARFEPVPADVDEFSPPGRPDLRFVASASPLSHSAYWFGIDGYRRRSAEGAQIRIWEELCRNSSHVVEIGAHVGTMTVSGARASTGRYVAVEPHPAIAAILRRTLAANDLPLVEVAEVAAVADGRTSVELVHAQNDPHTLSTSSRVRSASTSSGIRAVTVAARQVTELVQGADLLKLDVEGLELELLEALLPTLDPWPTMMIEVLDYFDDLKRWLDDVTVQRRVAVAVVTWRGLVPIEPGSLSSTMLLVRYGSNDLVLTPTDGPREAR